MKHLIVSFKSRNSLYSFAKVLRSNGVNVNIINTPRNISTSCGLSIKVELRYFNLVLNQARQTNPEGLVGIFTETKQNSHTQYQRLF